MNIRKQYDGVRMKIPKGVRNLVETRLNELVPSTSMAPGTIQNAQSAVYKRLITLVEQLGNGFSELERTQVRRGEGATKIGDRHVLTAVIDAAYDLGIGSPAGQEVLDLGEEIYSSMGRNTQRRYVFVDEDQQLDPRLIQGLVIS